MKGLQNAQEENELPSKPMGKESTKSALYAIVNRFNRLANRMVIERD